LGHRHNDRVVLLEGVTPPPPFWRETVKDPDFFDNLSYFAVHLAVAGLFVLFFAFSLGLSISIIKDAINGACQSP